MDYAKLNKLYNEVVDRAGIDPDKYEREDAFFGIYEDVKKGMELIDAFIQAFNIVHEYELTETMFKSCLANVNGFKKDK